ncbi:MULTISPECIES: SLATT domain-containing protein [unclassified Micromonospora]|uniref:SLATT domain-containing protein n=1 Tax=unclassified Micromonospora TaxID=2617518 RepID=UPI003627FA96
MARYSRDLSLIPFPQFGPADWTDPEKLLNSLHQHVLTKASETAKWYLLRKRPKKRWSRVLRATAIIAAGVGGVVPLAHVSLTEIPIELGYVSFAIAAASLAFDHYFGLSSGWMRDMETSLAIQRRLDSFQYEWLRNISAAMVDGNHPAHFERRLSSLASFSDDIAELVAAETGDWKREFQTNLSVLQGSTSHGASNTSDSTLRPRGATSESAPSA